MVIKHTQTQCALGSVLFLLLVGSLASCQQRQGQTSQLKTDNETQLPQMVDYNSFYRKVIDLRTKISNEVKSSDTQISRQGVVKRHVLTAIGELGGIPRWQVQALLNQLIDDDVKPCGTNLKCSTVLGYDRQDIPSMMDRWANEFQDQKKLDPCNSRFERYRQRIIAALKKPSSIPLTEADFQGRIFINNVRSTLKLNYPQKYLNLDSYPTTQVASIEDWENVKTFYFKDAPSIPLSRFLDRIKQLEEIKILSYFWNNTKDISVFAEAANRASTLMLENAGVTNVKFLGYFSNIKEVKILTNGPFTPLPENFPSPFPYARKLTIQFGKEIKAKELQTYLNFLKKMPVLRELNLIMPPIDDLEIVGVFEPLPRQILTISHTCMREGSQMDRTPPQFFGLYANAQNMTIKGCKVDYLEPIAQRAKDQKILWKTLVLNECKSGVTDHLTIPSRLQFPNLLVPSVHFVPECRDIYSDDLNKIVVDSIVKGSVNQSSSVGLLD